MLWFDLEWPQSAEEPFVLFFLFRGGVLFGLLGLGLLLRLRFVLEALEGVEAGKQTRFDDHRAGRRFKILRRAVHRHIGGKRLQLDPGALGIARQTTHLFVAASRLRLTALDFLQGEQPRARTGQEDAQQEEWVQLSHSNRSTSANGGYHSTGPEKKKPSGKESGQQSASKAVDSATFSFPLRRGRGMVCTVNTARRRATYEDLLKVPDLLIAEIIDGELIASPRPASPHARATSVIGRVLDPFDQHSGGPGGPPGGWWILFEPELHCGADVLVPDLAGWRRERMPILANVPYFELAPDWVCEVVSATTGRLDRVRKMPIYAREQVGRVWLVDPLMRTVEVYRLQGQQWVLLGTHGGAERVRAEPFEAIELDISRWWLEEPTP